MMPHFLYNEDDLGWRHSEQTRLGNFTWVVQQSEKLLSIKFDTC